MPEGTLEIELVVEPYEAVLPPMAMAALAADRAQAAPSRGWSTSPRPPRRREGSAIPRWCAEGSSRTRGAEGQEPRREAQAETEWSVCGCPRARYSSPPLLSMKSEASEGVVNERAQCSSDGSGDVRPKRLSPPLITTSKHDTGEADTAGVFLWEEDDDDARADDVGGGGGEKRGREARERREGRRSPPADVTSLSARPFPRRSINGKGVLGGSVVESFVQADERVPRKVKVACRACGILKRRGVFRGFVCTVIKGVPC